MKADLENSSLMSMPVGLDTGVCVTADILAARGQHTRRGCPTQPRTYQAVPWDCLYAGALLFVTDVGRYPNKAKENT